MENLPGDHETIQIMVRDLLRAPRTGCIAGLAALVIAIGGCATPIPAPASPATAPPPPVVASAPPEWRPGDRWVYGWTSGSDAGTKTVEVIEIREINTVKFYLVQVGDLQHFYTREIQWAGTMREQKIESRMSPPEPWFVWPLEKGQRWTHHATYEDGKGKSEVTDRFAVVATEVVEVPAGRFNALRVVRETDRRDIDEYWYAPEVRFYVKWIGRRGDAQFEEQLREYRQAPRLDPGSPSPRSPSTTR
jgi:hypothetical protein